MGVQNIVFRNFGKAFEKAGDLCLEGFSIKVICYEAGGDRNGNKIVLRGLGDGSRWAEFTIFNNIKQATLTFYGISKSFIANLKKEGLLK